MKVQLKYGHHNGDRFYHAGEILECSKALYASLVKQGLAVPVTESKADKKQESESKQPAETKEQDMQSEQPKENAVQETEKAEGSTSEPAESSQSGETSENGAEKTKAK